MANDNLARALDDEVQAADDAQSTAAVAEATAGRTAVGGADSAGATTDAGSPAAGGAVGQGTFGADLALIRDIPVKLSMEIGHTRITIEELLKLGAGSVVELERMADEPLDVLVNGTLVAHGEAVVVGDRFGIRLIDVVSPSVRLGGIV